MHDGMEKGSLVISRKQHILICALAGLLILGGVLGLSAHSEDVYKRQAPGCPALR